MLHPGTGLAILGGGGLADMQRSHPGGHNNDRYYRDGQVARIPSGKLAEMIAVIEAELA